MIEENIIEWLEISDTIQKIDIYNGKNPPFLFKINFILSQYAQFPEYFYLLFIFLYFAQIWELNILKINVEEDSILEIMQYVKKVFLLQDLITDNKAFAILFVSSLLLFIISFFLCVINIIALKNQKKYRFILSLNALINTVFLYYLIYINLETILMTILCVENNRLVICSFKKISFLIKFILIMLYAIIMIISLFFSSLYFNNIGSINGSNVKCRINCNFTILIFIIKLIYVFFHFMLNGLINGDKSYLLLYGYYFIFLLGNFSISVYTYKKLFYYNHLIHKFFFYGWLYTTWFSFCIFLKKLINIKDITLFVIIGLIIITVGFYYNSKYRTFKLITEFNIFEANSLKDIEIYITMLLTFFKAKDNKSKILISGVIKRFEEFISTNAELSEQYYKLLNDKHLQKKFTSYNELTILSIISIIYSHNIEKSKDSTDIILTNCYFLVNKFKNPVYAIWLCSKIKSCTHLQSYYKYVLMEEIKEYLIKILKKNTNKLTIKHVQISSVILFNQYVDLFKMKIYDATCSQIEYFDILKNSVTTTKTTENFLKIGEDILTLRKDILNLWEKIILLNPFSDESEKDYIIYLDTILQDDILLKTEEKRFNTLKTEKLPERNNPYFSMFNQELSAVLLVDGYSYNGKVFYATPNFASLFMFTGKEVLNTSIDDLLPDVIQNFHRYIIEDAIKFSNLGYMFKKSKDSLLKGKNGLIFNIKLYVKPSPNLSFGLIFFVYIQKFPEQDFIIILDEHLKVSGFTEMYSIGTNFTMNNNNYGLSHYVNGHHIGLIIPDIILQMNYDNKSNSFSLSKTNIDLKGSLYSIHNLKDLDSRIEKILEVLKERKNNEPYNENKFNSFEEYEELIRELNLNHPKSYSIFFRIESHSFINGKYKYYRIYVINDLLSGNENPMEIQSQNVNTLTYDDDNNFFNNPKLKLKDLNKVSNYTITTNHMDHLYRGPKLIKLRTEQNRKSNILNLNDINKIKKQTNVKEINIAEEDNYNKQNEVDSSNDNNKNIVINYSKRSHPSSILTQSSAESVEFNKLKNEIINKTDSFYVKLMKYLYTFFMILDLILIIYDFLFTVNKINSMVKYLKENLFFTDIKVCSSCIYQSSVYLKMIKRGYVGEDHCIVESCHELFGKLLDKCLKEVRFQKDNISYFHSDFQEIFEQKINVDLHIYNRTFTDHLSLDLNNFLNLIISHGMRIIANLSDIFDNTTEVDSLGILLVYSQNLIKNSLKLFYSDYSSFVGSEKELKLNKETYNSPLRLIISILLFSLLIIIFSYLICKINFMELYFLDRLINFTSSSFDEYLKKLDELKKKFRDDTNEDEDKNGDEFEGKGDDPEGKNENSKIKDTTKDSNNKNSKKKKSKQNKLQQQRIKKKRVMSTYFYKINLFFGLKIGIISVISLTYFILTIVLFNRLKTNYKKFDSTVEEINNAYFDSFKIFLIFMEQINKYMDDNNKTNLIIPKDSEIDRPKFGNSLMYLTRNTKYSKEALNKLNTLYSNNACVILSSYSPNDNFICENILSSILTKGMEQAIIQMGIIITSVIDELNSLKEYKTLKEIAQPSTSFSDYVIYVGKFMLFSYLATQEIFEDFRNNENVYMCSVANILLVLFFGIKIILILFMLYLIYSYKNVIYSFFNFIGILPAKFIYDDDYLYKTIIKLEKDFY